MSGMDGIGPGRRPIRPERSRGASGPKKAEKAAGDFSVGETADVGESQEAALEPTPRFDSLQRRILEGVEEELSKEEVLHAVIDDEVRQSFGQAASKEMVDSIARAFDDNESLKALFNRLYGQALRQRQAGQ